MKTAMELAAKKKFKPKLTSKNFRRSLKTNLREKREKFGLSALAVIGETKITTMRFTMLERGAEPYMTETIALMKFFGCNSSAELWPTAETIAIIEK